jgi:hypothetical protein
MLLRDHPPQSRRGVPNWPAVGTWICELENTGLKRKIGALKRPIPSRIQSVDSFLLCIDYEDSS